MNDIQFIWQGKSYNVASQASGLTYIVLPNGTVIRPRWLESMPPRLHSATEIPHVLQHANPGEIAQYMGNAILAREAD